MPCCSFPSTAKRKCRGCSRTNWNCARRKNRSIRKDIVGKNVTFWVDFADSEHRFFNGFVNRFSYSGEGDRLQLYKAQVVPWLWFLTQNSNCRIFQDKKTTEIIEQVFSDRGFSDFQDKTEGQFEPRPTACSIAKPISILSRG